MTWSRAPSGGSTNPFRQSIIARSESPFEPPTGQFTNFGGGSAPSLLSTNPFARDVASPDSDGSLESPPAYDEVVERPPRVEEKPRPRDDRSADSYRNRDRERQRDRAREREYRDRRNRDNDRDGYGYPRDVKAPDLEDEEYDRRSLTRHHSERQERPHRSSRDRHPSDHRRYDDDRYERSSSRRDDDRYESRYDSRRRDDDRAKREARRREEREAYYRERERHLSPEEQQARREERERRRRERRERRDREERGHGNRPSSKSDPPRLKDKKGRPLDVIDKMDVTGLFGPGAFHHDGPFDACNPHRNKKNSTRPQPVAAFNVEGPNNSLAISVNDVEGRARQEAAVFGREYTEEDPEQTPDPQELVNPNKQKPVHGHLTMGLGTSTYVDGMPASKDAIQEAAASHLSRSKSKRLQQGVEAGLLGRVRSLRRKD